MWEDPVGMENNRNSIKDRDTEYLLIIITFSKNKYLYVYSILDILR